MTTATATRTYYIAINAYRSSTDEGFYNTWDVYRCRDAAHQRQLLTDGLPVRDLWHLDNAGRQSRAYSTNGIRMATRSEIREATRHRNRPELLDRD